ncbi:glycosyltransferase family 2 protein [Roseomonas sp. HF4]|uniref:glycosyltransferase family 2 protein n=1 Tax=Roseomonas sp. HF4 TaxID=2562313 RepID=UPI0014856E6C|nr:glycosyltransferase family 2 protein [Roseomonas sp. HF4]
MPTVDVVIPNYRYGRYLRDCVGSIRGQGIEGLRILIVDNASDDDSRQVARSLAAEDARIHLLLREKNLGPQASFNAGIDWAEADYMLIIPADDMLTESALDRALTTLEIDRGAAMAIGEEAIFDETVGPPDLTRMPHQLHWRFDGGCDFIRTLCDAPNTSLACASVLVRTPIQKRAGHYRPELPYTDDWEMMMRLALFGRVARSQCVQGLRREHGANMSCLFWRRRIDSLRHREDAFVSFFSHEGAAMAEASDLLRIVRARLGAAAWWAAASHLVKGDVNAAMELLRFAYSRAPRSRWMPPLEHLWRMPNARGHALRVIRDSLLPRR